MSRENKSHYLILFEIIKEKIIIKIRYTPTHMGKRKNKGILKVTLKIHPHTYEEKTLWLWKKDNPSDTPPHIWGKETL